MSSQLATTLEKQIFAIDGIRSQLESGDILLLQLDKDTAVIEARRIALGPRKPGGCSGGHREGAKGAQLLGRLRPNDHKLKLRIARRHACWVKGVVDEVLVDERRDRVEAAVVASVGQPGEQLVIGWVDIL